MSHIYIKEPPTTGKVLVKTTLGDLDVELWSKETPLACRNFVQLCMEGYYNGTIFHRVVKDFIAQGGDPTGTGEGGESIYGQPFKDEFHSRLKFMRRGLVAMANGGPNDNGSQFFFTLGRVDELNNKHTLFGKLTGNTLYNMLRFNDIPTDKEDRPLDPAPKIIKTEVLLNPFDDIVPRVDKRQLDRQGEGKPKSQSKATKNFSLLSFGEEAEEDEEETMVVSKVLKIKSSHDVLTEDPKLSSQPAVVETSRENRDGEYTKSNKKDDGGDSDEAKFDTGMRDLVRKRKRRARREEEGGEEEETKLSRKEELHLEAQKLKRELRTAKRRKEREDDEKAQQDRNELESLPEPVRALRKEQDLYKSKQKVLGKGGNREQQTLEMLTKFKSKLFTAREGAGDGEGMEEGGSEGMEEGGRERVEQEGREEMEGDITDEKEDANWLSHRLTFSEERWAVSKDASVQNEDTFDIYDPRNPINKRRREDSKQQQRQKHGRDRTGN